MILASVLLVLGAAVASTVDSTHPFHSVLRGTITPLIFAEALVVGLLAEKVTPWIRWAVSALVVVVFLGAVWQIHTGIGLQGGRLWRVYGFLHHPNDASLIAVLLPWTPWILWPLGLVTIILSGSRNAMLGLGVVCLLLITPIRVRLLMVGFAVVGIFAFTHAAFFTSLESRVGHWAVAMQMYRESPWLGKGPYTFVDFYLPYSATIKPMGFTPEVAIIPWAHSLYLEQLAERGIVGLIAFAVPLVWAWNVADRRARAALAAFLVMGVLDLTFLKPWVLIAYFGLVTMAWAGRDV